MINFAKQLRLIFKSCSCMKGRFVILFSAALLAVGGCKSHKQTVVRQPQRVEHAGMDSYETKRKDSKPASGASLGVDKRVGKALVKEAKGWLGVPYRYGGESKSGADCSGMLMSIYRDVAGLKLPRNSAAQQEYCIAIEKRRLEPGDLVFFSSSKGRGRVSHVGMYIGSGKMIHASTSRGVIVSGLDEKYYLNHYHSSGRVYGVTYAATGAKPADNNTGGGLIMAESDPKPKSAGEVREISLDDFVAAKPKPSPEKAISLDEFVAQSAVKTDSVVQRADSLALRSDSISSQPDSISAPSDSISTRPDSVAAGRVEPEPAKPAVVMVNGRPVVAEPVESPRRQQSDTVVADTISEAATIRETVVKAMKFGK